MINCDCSQAREYWGIYLWCVVCGFLFRVDGPQKRLREGDKDEEILLLDRVAQMVFPKNRSLVGLQVP